MNNTRLQKLLEMKEENPLDTFVIYALAMEYNGLNQSDLALKYLQDCLAVDATYVPAYYQLALVYQALQNEQEAKICLQKGLSLLQQSPDVKTKNEFRSLLDELEY